MKTKTKWRPSKLILVSVFCPKQFPKPVAHMEQTFFFFLLKYHYVFTRLRVLFCCKNAMIPLLRRHICFELVFNNCKDSKVGSFCFRTFWYFFHVYTLSSCWVQPFSNNEYTCNSLFVCYTIQRECSVPLNMFNPRRIVYVHVQSQR